MSLEWTHDAITCPGNQGYRTLDVSTCTLNTSCEHFPTLDDRSNMAQAAYWEYAKADDAAFLDFLRDVMILALRRNNFTLGELLEQAAIAYMLNENITIPKGIAL